MGAIQRVGMLARCVLYGGAVLRQSRKQDMKESSKARKGWVAQTKEEWLLAGNDGNVRLQYMAMGRW